MIEQMLWTFINALVKAWLASPVLFTLIGIGMVLGPLLRLQQLSQMPPDPALGYREMP